MTVSSETSSNEAEAHAILATLRPAAKPTVYKLVEQAGLDVSDWSKRKEQTLSPASNPNWAFMQDEQQIVVNIWFDEIFISASKICVRMTARENSKNLTGVRKSRALELDRVIETAFTNSLPIRTIILEGRKRGKELASQTPSVVSARKLDTGPWYVLSYESGTGESLIARGDPTSFVDQYSAKSVRNGTPQRVPVTGEVFQRDRRVRDAALERASGFCEYCGCRGFPTSNNGIYLETHHIIPLSEGGADNLTNVAALCADHHRQAHVGINANEIRIALQTKLSKLLI
jgi:5-methylcytosine-specific restriction enzyme A